MPVNNLPHTTTGLYAYITAWVKTAGRHGDASIVVSVENKNHQSYFWNGHNVMSYVFNLNQWQQAGSMVRLPQFKNPDDTLLIYCYATKGLTYIDDFDIRFGTHK